MGVKISELAEANAIQNSDVLPIVQDGETKKVSASTLLNQINQSINDIETELANKLSENDNLLIYRGAIPDTDLNNIEITGIYYISNQTVQNAPSIDYAYSFLIVISNGLIVHQYLIKPFALYFGFREYSGVPERWTQWNTI